MYENICECTELDWECDTGYYRNEENECVKEKKVL